MRMASSSSVLPSGTTMQRVISSPDWSGKGPIDSDVAWPPIWLGGGPSAPPSPGTRPLALHPDAATMRAHRARNIGSR